MKWNVSNLRSSPRLFAGAIRNKPIAASDVLVEWMPEQEPAPITVTISRAIDVTGRDRIPAIATRGYGSQSYVTQLMFSARQDITGRPPPDRGRAIGLTGTSAYHRRSVMPSVHPLLFKHPEKK